FHGSSAGSRFDSTLNSSPSTEIVSSFASTRACRLPSTESYLSRCASVCAFVRSLTATKSMFLSPSAARMMFRPIRPNPLIPTLTAIDVLQTNVSFYNSWSHVHRLQPADALRLHHCL